MIPIIQVYEHQTLRMGEHTNGVLFTKAMWQILAAYYEQHHGKYYQLIHRGVRFKQYVGVIQTRHLVIEILPKIDNQPESLVNWQNVLVDMLQYCQLIKVETIGVGQVRLKSNTILDIYFGLFLKEVAKVLQKGLPKQYANIEHNHKSLKGQILFPKHLQHNQGHPERFYTKFQALQEQHLFSQIVHEALQVLQQIPLKKALKTQLEAVRRAFPVLPTYEWNPQDFEQLLQHPDYHSYHYLIELARLILLNFSADIRYGRHRLVALLFDMNVLFEEYIFQQLKQLAGKYLSISRQRSVPFWQRRYIRPDIVLEVKGEKMVIDTKWKLLPNNNPSIEDLKQLYVYCHYFKAKKGILLYPLAFGKTRIGTAFPFLDAAQNIECQLLFVNVLKENGQLKNNIGEEILNHLNHCTA